MTKNEIMNELKEAIIAYDHECITNGNREGSTAAYGALIRVKTIGELATRYYGVGFGYEYLNGRRHFKVYDGGVVWFSR